MQAICRVTSRSAPRAVRKFIDKAENGDDGLVVFLFRKISAEPRIHETAPRQVDNRKEDLRRNPGKRLADEQGKPRHVGKPSFGRPFCRPRFHETLHSTDCWVLCLGSQLGKQLRERWDHWKR